MEDFNNPQERPTLTAREKELMLIVLIRNEEAFLTGRSQLSTTHFNEYEAYLSLPWEVTCEFYDEHNELPSEEHVVTGVTARMEEDELLLSEDAEIDAFERMMHWGFHMSEDELRENVAMWYLRRFLHERLALKVSNALSQGFLPANIPELLEENSETAREIESLGTSSPPGPLEDQWDEHDHWLEQFRGREILGLRTGMTELDRRTSGLHGLTIFGAGPGVGKTSLCIECSLGVCRHHDVNDCVVLFLSLEMSQKTIQTRIKCSLGDIDFATLMQGSPELRNEPRHLTDEQREQNEQNGRRMRHLQTWFNAADRRKLMRARQRACDEQIQRRMKIFDREAVGTRFTANDLARYVRDFKQSVGASRSLLAVDYLQVLDVPPDVDKQGDIAADRYRVRLLQDYLGTIQTDEHSDCVLVISEARKPSNSKEAWGQGLSELMGSSRLGYAAGTVLLYGTMNHEELGRYYGAGPHNAETVRNAIIREGQAPITLTLAKGRDGTHRGSWGLEFSYRVTRFRELQPRPCPGEDIPEGEAPTANYLDSASTNDHRSNDEGRPELPPSRRRRR